MQCAQVDRPNAEKALAKCGRERAKLEAKLAKVVAALKKKAKGKGALLEVQSPELSSAREEDMSSATMEAAVSAAALIQYKRISAHRMEDMSLLSATSASRYASMS